MMMNDLPDRGLNQVAKKWRMEKSMLAGSSVECRLLNYNL